VIEIEVGQQDIDNLGSRLDRITDPGERVLMAAILALAAKAIRGGAAEDRPEVSDVPGQDPPVVIELDDSAPSFRDEIAAAFTPGVIVEVAAGLDAVKVGHIARVKRRGGGS
jgi:hypothetical protein